MNIRKLLENNIYFDFFLIMSIITIACVGTYELVGFIRGLIL